MLMDRAPGDRMTATAFCQHCNWSARLTGDDAVEVATFLRSLLLEHGERCHPDRFPKERPS